MKTLKDFGISDWANFALKMTLRAANVKDYKLRRQIDRRMKEIAQNLAMGKGYIIATDRELERMYPSIYKATGNESKKMIWAIEYSEFRRGNKMGFCPVR